MCLNRGQIGLPMGWKHIYLNLDYGMVPVSRLFPRVPVGFVLLNARCFKRFSFFRRFINHGYYFKSVPFLLRYTSTFHRVRSQINKAIS